MSDRFWQPSPNNFWFWPKGDHYLDIRSSVRSGDVLLFASGNSQIEDAQRRWNPQFKAFGENYPGVIRYDDNAWRWTHAAIYIDADHLICEAVPRFFAPPGGVRVGSLEGLITSSNAIEVLRHFDLDDGRGLDEGKGRTVAKAAVDYRHLKYDLKACWEFWRTGGMRDEEADLVICSSLCLRALVRGGLDVRRPKHIPPTPSFLGQAAQFKVIKVESLPVRKPSLAC